MVGDDGGNDLRQLTTDGKHAPHPTCQPPLPARLPHRLARIFSHRNSAPVAATEPSLIPTDGSELAGKAVQHGIALAKRIGAGVTVLTVLPPFHTFTTDAQMIEDTRISTKCACRSMPASSLYGSKRQEIAKGRGQQPQLRALSRAALDEIADGDHSTF
jgi:hypothetical protein